MPRIIQKWRIVVIALIAVCAGIVAQMIWRFDWTTFLPDLIVGAFTGLAVGFVLWRAELAKEIRDQAAKAVTDWEVVRSRVARAIVQGYIFQPQNLKLLAFGVRDVRKVTDRHPLHAWATEHGPLGVNELIAFLAAAEEVERVAGSLDAHINAVSYSYDPSRPYINNQAAAAARSFLDLNRSQRSPASDEDMGELWAILRDGDVIARALEFRAAMFFLESSWRDLGAVLESETEPPVTGTGEVELANSGQTS